jgi:hypothetical protein
MAMCELLHTSNHHYFDGNNKGPLSQQVFGIGGYAEGILQRLQGERTFSPSPGNSLFATTPHRATCKKIGILRPLPVAAPMGRFPMARGLPGADSSVPVTYQINGRSLIDLATDLFGEVPVVWGRYFTSTRTGGAVEYRHVRENRPLRSRGIRVMPIARQTKHVSRDDTLGADDAKDNVEDVISTFGANYLEAQGGKFLMFLDVEGDPSLSEAYYRGWANTVVSHSSAFSGGAVTIVPGVYATQGDDPTWHALAAAAANGVPCEGVWVARWRIRGCGAPPDFDVNMPLVRPSVRLPCDILLWQYADECHGGNGFDCNEINPNIDVPAFLKKCVSPPDTPIA